MQQMQSIVAIFKDECDAGSWAAYLDGISAVLSLTANKDLDQSVERLKSLGVAPALVIVSSRVYPTDNPKLAPRVREFFPDAEFLLLSSSEEPTPPLFPLSADAIRHLEVNPLLARPLDQEYFKTVLQKLVAGHPLSMGDRLKPATPVKGFELTCSAQKEELLISLDEMIAGEGDACEIFRQKAALLADELMENALFGAPRDAAGEKLFRKGEPRHLLSGERLAFRFGFDGETLAMEMTDSWGTLDPDLVLEHLARNQAEPGFAEEPGIAEELGGRGLFLIWRFFDRFHISVFPGNKTVVGGDLQLSAGLDPEAPRGFHITAHKEGDAA